MTSAASGRGLAGRFGRAAEYVAELWRRREFAIALGLGNFTARNAGTALGLFWWVLNPLLLGGVYFLIFGVIFGERRPPDFLIYLLSGMFPFHFTSQAMTGGANSIIQNSKLLANLRFPRLVLPISTLIESLVGFLASLCVFFLIAGFEAWRSDSITFGIDYKLAYLPLVIALHLVFNLGLAGLTARLAVPFRDINNLLPYVNRIWFYLTPIIWPLSFLDGANPTVQRLVELNPMFDFVGLYRAVMMGGVISLDQVVGALLWTIAVGVLGITVFVRYEGHMVRYL